MPPASVAQFAADAARDTVVTAFLLISEQVAWGRTAASGEPCDLPVSVALTITSAGELQTALVGAMAFAKKGGRGRRKRVRVREGCSDRAANLGDATGTARASRRKSVPVRG